jgi:hypothetical protein
VRVSKIKNEETQIRALFSNDLLDLTLVTQEIDNATAAAEFLVIKLCVATVAARNERKSFGGKVKERRYETARCTELASLALFGATFLARLDLCAVLGLVSNHGAKIPSEI